MKPQVFVFGSNLAGRHGAGAAAYARKHHGAVYGVGIGRQGSSYGIPTKDANIKTLDVMEIQKYVNVFKAYAALNTHEEFKVTRIGCGLAGYYDDEIAPLFEGAPTNCIFSVLWKEFLGDEYTYFDETLGNQ